MLAVRRVRAHSALFAAVFGVCLLLAALGTGLVGYLDAQARQAVLQGFGALPSDAHELRYDAPKSDDPATQTARALAIIDRELTRARGGDLPVRVTTADAESGDDTVWTITADVERIEPADLPALAVVGDRIETALLDDPDVAVQGVEKSGTLDDHAAALQLEIAPLAAVEPVPLLLVAAIGLVTLAELGRLLDGVRRRETSLLRSRGESAARVGAITAAETVIIAGVGTLAGTGAALALLAAIGSSAPRAAPIAAVALAVVAVAVALMTGIALSSARRTFRRGAADDSGRARRLAAPALVLLLVVAAALSLWRFLQFGSPLSPTEAGAEVDPLAVLAPALCLAAIAVLGLAVLPVLAAGVERFAARGPGVRATMVSREVSRRVRMIASPFVVIALAGGGLVLAASYQPTWATASAVTADLHAGADLVVTGVDDASEIAAVPGVAAATPVAPATGTLADETTVHVSAVPAAGLVAAGSTAQGTVDTARLAEDIAFQPPVVPLPEGTTGLTVTVQWSGVAPAVTALVMDRAGLVTEVDFSATGTSPAAITARLPDDGVKRSLVALDAHLDPPASAAFEPIVILLGSLTRLSTVAAGVSHPLDLGDAWTVAPGTTVNGQVSAFGDLGYSGQIFSSTDVRLQPAQSATTPVVLSRAFARAISAKVGDTPNLDIGVVPGSFPVRVADIVEQVPGSPGNRGLLVDLAAMQVAQLRAGWSPTTVDTVWAKSAEPAATADRIRSTVDGSHVTGPGLDASTEVLSAVPVALWAGMIGGALLALVTLGAVAGELLRLRADEVVVLRALGMPPAELARMRGLELALVVAAAVVVALIGGVVTCLLTVLGLTRAAILDPFAGSTVPLRIDGLSLAVAFAGMLAAIALILFAYGARVRRQAVTLVATESIR